jgi:hypothetical protein
MGAVVYEHLLKVCDNVPFPLIDSIELWLLDSNNMPLALLNAVADEKDIEEYQVLDWRAGRLCRETFVFPGRDNAAVELIDFINGRANNPPAAQWFKRNLDGSASSWHGHNIDERLIGRKLVADAFPEFFITDVHGDEYHARLIRAFLEWQSPWLLLLDTLTPETRQYYESCARKQAMIVDQQYMLYPEVIDQSFIRAARVEAKLRKTQMQAADQDEVMSTFYIELHPSPTE